MADNKQTAAHPHAKHRERVRNLFLQSGLEGFSDHNVLELLLFYAIPQRDTNLTAHNLIERFGSLRGVLDAPTEELSKVSGMGPYAATFLSILPQLVRRYLSENGEADELPEDGENAVDAARAFLRSRFIGETEECVYLLSFGSNGQQNGCAKLSTGTFKQVSVSERTVLEAAFRMRAVSVILAHNHPNGIAVPSRSDIEATEKIRDALSRCDITLLDHLIVAGEDCLCMASHPIFRTVISN